MRRLTALGPRGADDRGQEAGRAATSWCAGWRETGKLPVPNFSAGGIATPADAALMMQLGAEAVFVGSGIFKSADPASAGRKAIVQATTHFKDPGRAARRSARTSATPWSGSRSRKMPEEELLQTRGW